MRSLFFFSGVVPAQWRHQLLSAVGSFVLALLFYPLTVVLKLAQLTGVKVKLIHSYRGVILDSSADITPCTPTEVALGCTSTFEQWRILIDSLLYKADKNGDQLKASRDKDASIQRIQGVRVLILGQLEFPNLQWKKTVLKDLLKVEVGGIFEYLNGIVKKLRDSPHTQCKWTSDQRDKYSKTWDAMYEKVEVPI